MFTDTVSRNVRDKGDRLLKDGKVQPLDPDQGRYTVEGDHGTYNVTVVHADHAYGWCNCFATRLPCSHLYAASVYALANPVQRKLRLVPADPFEGLN